ncbi:hypothetical protein EV401DRAFT_1464492 [Pisolithus croceorrhizus]|nr:hypothetical protein EV401DRAFT_1464492 [Pisolithus croceorrhizus]
MLSAMMASGDEREDTATAGEHFSFPELDERIRLFFPKLKFSSLKDASWVLSASSPPKCATPADTYFLLKSFDSITHDFSVERVFDGYRTDNPPVHELELCTSKMVPSGP